MGDRVGDVAERRSGGDQAGEDGLAVGRGAGEAGDRARVGDDGGVGQPCRGRVERGQAVDECTVFELQRVQEVEGGVERNVAMDMVARWRAMGVGGGLLQTHLTTIEPLTGYAQEAILRVTNNAANIGYDRRARRFRMDALFALFIIVAGLETSMEKASTG